MSIITTVGGTDSNSYISVDEANEYFANRLHVEKWNDFFDYELALIYSTRLIDWHFNFNGEKTYLDQSLQWPRVGAYDSRNNVVIDNDVIPEQIKNAVCELALVSIDEDRLTENDLMGIEKIKVGSISIDVDTDHISSMKKDPIPKIINTILYGISRTESSSIFRRIVRF